MSGKTRSSKQPSVVPENGSDDMPASPPKDQLIPAGAAGSKATVSPLPGFSEQQTDSLERLLTRKFNDFFIRLQNLYGPQQQKESQDSPPVPTIEQQDPPRNRRERRDLQFLRGRFASPDDANDHQDSDDESQALQAPISSSFSSSAKPASFRAEDVGFFDPGFQPEPEHGNTTPGPVVNAGKHVYYLDVFVFVDRLKELARKQGAAKVIDLIPSCLRGSALIWWTVEVDDMAKELLEGSKKLEQWTTILIKQFRTAPTEALTALCASTYNLQDLRRGMSPRMWIHGQLHLARSAELDSVFNQLTIIYGRMGPYFQEQLDPPSPSTRLSDFLRQVDMKTPAWRSRAQMPQRLQPHSQPHPPPPARDQRDNRPSTKSAEPHRRGYQYEYRPKLPRTKDNGKQAYTYMVGVADDGTPQWADEDPDAEDLDYAD